MVQFFCEHEKVKSSKPSQAEIGRALGVVRSHVTALKKRGMPVDTVENALRWHRTYIMSKASPIGIDPQAAALRTVERVEALGRIVLDSRGRGKPEVMKAMRAALRRVPQGCRQLVDIPRPVWMCLIDHVYRDIPKGEIGAHPMSDEDFEQMGHYWYSVAAGERTPF